MGYSEVAEHAFKAARAFYTGGLKRKAWVGATEEAPPGPGKSPNKMLLDAEHAKALEVIDIADQTGRDLVFELRRSVGAQEFMRSAEAEIAGDCPIRYGEELVRLAVKGANCGELASVAAHAAWEKLGRPGDVKDVAVASLEKPGDHGWCVVGPAAAVGSLAGKTIAGLKDVTHSPEPVFVVDAWTNLCCPIGEFHDLVQGRAAKWATGGKRVSWIGKDGNRKGWYPPSGDYIAAFVGSVIRIQYGLEPYG